MREFLSKLISLGCGIIIAVLIAYLLVNMQPATYDAKMDLCVRYYRDYEYCKLKVGE